jgi:hypothetical protein
VYSLINTPSGEMWHGPEDTADTGRHGPTRADTGYRSGPRHTPPQNEWTGHYSSWRPPFLCSQPIVVKLESRY